MPEFSYRTSSFQYKTDYISGRSGVTFEKKGNREEIEETIKKKRKKVLDQPLEYPSAGSVFRNPEGTFAGKLIEDLGLKGKSLGDAEVSENMPTSLLTKGHATGHDVKNSF